MAKAFPNDALDSITHHSSGCGLFGNSQAQARITQSIWRGQQGKSPTRATSRLGKNPPVLDRPGQSRTARETGRTPFQDVGKLDAQASTTLGAARLEDQTAILSAHPRAKAMGTLTMKVAGLERSFHDRNSLSGDRRGRTAENGQW